MQRILPERPSSVPTKRCGHQRNTGNGENESSATKRKSNTFRCTFGSRVGSVTQVALPGLKPHISWVAVFMGLKAPASSFLLAQVSAFLLAQAFAFLLDAGEEREAGCSLPGVNCFYSVPPM